MRTSACLRHRILPLVAPFALLLMLLAGGRAQTLVVDAQSGPGSQFSDIGAAVDAAANGAVILVRPGSYFSFVIDGKSVTVLAEPGVEVLDLGGYVRVRNLAIDQAVILRGLSARGLSGPANFHCHDNRGRVLLDGCRADRTASNIGGYLIVERCDDVRVRNGVFFPISQGALRCVDSSLRIAQSLLVHGPFGSGSSIRDSDVELANGIVGGGGLLTPLLQLDDADVRVLGTSTLTTQLQLPGTQFVIGGTGGVRIDPLANVDAGASVPFDPSLDVVMQSMPVVAADTEGPGGMASATMAGSANGVGALFVGLPGLPIAVDAELAAITLSPGSDVLVASGGTATPLQAGYVLPPSPLLQGAAVTWQGATIDPVNGLQISNGVTFVHF